MEHDMRKFNVTGLCVPSEDYMVDINDKLKKIDEMVNNRQYFVAVLDNMVKPLL